MKYYIFPNGSLKLQGIALADVITARKLGTFTQVSGAEYYKIKAQERAKMAYDAAAVGVAATVRVCEKTVAKAIKLKEAMKE